MRRPFPPAEVTSPAAPQTPMVAATSVPAANPLARPLTLARRVPQEHLAPGILTTADIVAPPRPEPESPEVIRARLTSYQAGMVRGRAAAPDPDAAPKNTP